MSTQSKTGYVYAQLARATVGLADALVDIAVTRDDRMSPVSRAGTLRRMLGALPRERVPVGAATLVDLGAEWNAADPEGASIEVYRRLAAVAEDLAHGTVYAGALAIREYEALAGAR
jgi:hypothetical protein